MDKEKIALFVSIVFLICTIAWLGLFYLLKKPPSEVTASGTIEATEVKVSSKVGGRISEIAVEEGDRVRKGQTLVVFDAPEIKAKLREANAAGKAASAQYDVASKNFDRAKDLYGQGVISKKNYDEAKGMYEVAQSNLKQAQAMKDLAETALSETIVTAPISGTVTVKAVEAGEVVNAGSPVVTITNLSKISLMVYVSEAYVGKIKLGQSVVITTDSYPKEKFIGRVIYISPQAEFTPKHIQTKEERVTQVFGVKIEVPNPEFKLKPGLPADAAVMLK